MDLEKYELTKVVEQHAYQFYSVGVRGRIKKVIVFQEFDIDRYNLAFGDWDESKNDIDDQIVSGNQDKQKVLSTVAFALFDFMKENPHATVIAVGSTPSRTRLYQMNISAFFEEIDEHFDIRGYVDGVWEHFMKGVKYEAFLLTNR